MKKKTKVYNSLDGYFILTAFSLSSYKSALFKSINHYNLLGKQELFIKMVNDAEISISFTVTFFTASCWNEN